MVNLFNDSNNPYHHTEENKNIDITVVEQEYEET